MAQALALGDFGELLQPRWERATQFCKFAKDPRILKKDPGDPQKLQNRVDISAIAAFKAKRIRHGSTWIQALLIGFGRRKRIHEKDQRPSVQNKIKTAWIHVDPCRILLA